jgi:hypothetical protein
MSILVCTLCKWRCQVFHCFYVKGLILVCNDRDTLVQVKEKLSWKLKMKDLEDLHFFLGMEVERDCEQHLVYINQIRYFKETFKHFHMNCKTIGMPLDLKTKLKKKWTKMMRWFFINKLWGLWCMPCCVFVFDLTYPISYRNPSFGLATKAKGVARVRAKGKPGSHIRDSRECRKVWGSEPSHSQGNSCFGRWSPGGLPKLQRPIWGVKSQWLVTLFISMESSWSVDV